MSANCELRIALDGDDHRNPGGTLSGRVIVRTSEATELRALTIQTVLVTRISQTNKTIPGRSATLYTGSLPAGEHTYPFSIPAPSLPLEHMSEYASLFWRLSARADVPWGADAEATHDFRLQPLEGTRWKTQPGATGDRHAVHAAGPTPSSGLGCFIVSLILLLVGIAFCSAALVFEFEDLKGAIALSAVFFVVGAIGVAISRWRPSPEEAARDAAAERSAQRVGAPQLAVELATGSGYRQAIDEQDALACSVWVKPDAPPLEVYATLDADVSWLVSRPGGEQSRTERVFRTLYTVSAPLTASAPGEYRGRVPLPAVVDVPSPMELPQGAVRWRLRAVVRSADLGWSGAVELPLALRPNPGPGFEGDGIVA